MNNSSRRRIYMDMEFTGLHQATQIISIGAISDQDDVFYAELTDYQKGLVTTDDGDFFQQHVFPNLLGPTKIEEMFWQLDKQNNCGIHGSAKIVKTALSSWLEAISPEPESIEIWADVLAFDWVLFCSLFKHAFNIPKNIYYIPFDLATLLLVKKVDPDINREEFAELSGNHPKHNALHDAITVRKCVEKLETMQ